MNKSIFSLCIGLIVCISVFLGISFNVYQEQENSNFLLSQIVFENSFIQQIILISIPTVIASFTSRYVTNTWQTRKEKLALQRKILDEVDDSLVNSLHILKNFNRFLWEKFTVINMVKEGLKVKELYAIDFPTNKLDYPNPKFEKEYDDFITKYVEGTLKLWKFSSTVKLYYEQKLFEDFSKIVESLEPARIELVKLYNSNDETEFDTHNTQFSNIREEIEAEIIQYKENLVKSKIKNLI